MFSSEPLLHCLLGLEQGHPTSIFGKYLFGRGLNTSGERLALTSDNLEGGGVAKRPTQNIHAKCLRKNVFTVALIVDASKAEVRFSSKLSIELFQGIQTFWR